MTKTGNQRSAGENMGHICITVYQVPVKVFIFYNANLETFRCCVIQNKKTQQWKRDFHANLKRLCGKNNLGQVKKKRERKFW